ncbi:hypothetical protein EDB84DRAFT_1625461 [Lactarius hengduanensis]|nr:hypothetical protein EDB84DRAFT_1625461 [Lactarius hengduanensis]
MSMSSTKLSRNCIVPALIPVSTLVDIPITDCLSDPPTVPRPSPSLQGLSPATLSKPSAEEPLRIIVRPVDKEKGSINSVPPSLPGPSPIGRLESLPTTTLLSSVTESTPSTISLRHLVSPRVPSSPSVSISRSHWAPETDAFPEGPDISFNTSFLRPTASARTSQRPSWLSTIDESQSSESPPITYSSPSSPSLTPIVSISVSAPAEPSPSPAGTVSISVSASATPSLSPSAPPTVPSPSLRAPSSTTVLSPILTPERSHVVLTRTPSSVSTASSISLGTIPLVDAQDNRLETDLAGEHSSSKDTFIVVDANCFRECKHDGTLVQRALSERARSERPPSEGPSVIITDDINRLLQYLHGVENDRQRDNQGVHDHLGEIQNELRNLADYMHEKEVPQVVPLPPVHLKDRSIGGSSVVSFGKPRGAPDYPSFPPTVTGKASPRVIAIPLTPPPRSPRSPSSLSSSISFLSSHHSDNFSLMESEPFESEALETELFET